MGLEARLLLGHCSTRLAALSGPSRIGPTDHFEGIRASHIKGQTLVEMAGTHHRNAPIDVLPTKDVTLNQKEQAMLTGYRRANAPIGRRSAVVHGYDQRSPGRSRLSGKRMLPPGADQRG